MDTPETDTRREVFFFYCFMWLHLENLHPRDKQSGKLENFAFIRFGKIEEVEAVVKLKKMEKS